MFASCYLQEGIVLLVWFNPDRFAVGGAGHAHR
jgi:hypothetical protein